MEETVLWITDSFSRIKDRELRTEEFEPMYEVQGFRMVLSIKD